MRKVSLIERCSNSDRVTFLNTVSEETSSCVKKITYKDDYGQMKTELFNVGGMFPTDKQEWILPADYAGRLVYQPTHKVTINDKTYYCVNNCTVKKYYHGWSFLSDVDGGLPVDMYMKDQGIDYYIMLYYIDDVDYVVGPSVNEIFTIGSVNGFKLDDGTYLPIYEVERNEIELNFPHGLYIYMDFKSDSDKKLFSDNAHRIVSVDVNDVELSNDKCKFVFGIKKAETNDWYVRHSVSYIDRLIEQEESLWSSSFYAYEVQ